MKDEDISIDEIDFIVSDLQRAISQIAGSIQLLRKKKFDKIKEKWKRDNGEN